MKTLSVALLVGSLVGAGAQSSASGPQTASKRQTASGPQTTSGQQTVPGSQTAPEAPTAPGPTTPAASTATSLRLTGTLEGFDAKARAIAVQTEAGTVRLALTSSTRIRQGRRSLDQSALDHMLESTVVVRYAESASGKTAVSLHFREAAPAHR
jgi:hypothetical protein